MLLTSLIYDSCFIWSVEKCAEKNPTTFFFFNYSRVFSFDYERGRDLFFINYMPKYAYSSRFILENVLYLGAKQLDALNLFETFFSRLVIFLIV